MRSTLVATIGKFNPPTIGHEKIAKQLRLVAEGFDADIAMVLTKPTIKPKKTVAPLEFEDRLRYCQKAFGADIVVEAPVVNAMGLCRTYHGRYSRIILVVGEDRLDMIDRIRKYNGKDYQFDDIGYLYIDRKDEVSSSLMRKLVVDGNYQAFRSLLPEVLKQDAWEIYMKCAKHLNPAVYEAFQYNSIALIA